LPYIHSLHSLRVWLCHGQQHAWNRHESPGAENWSICNPAGSVGQKARARRAEGSEDFWMSQGRR
jgi:hypothetical protein